MTEAQSDQYTGRGNSCKTFKKPKVKFIINGAFLRKNIKYTSTEDKVKVMTLWDEENRNKYISELLNNNVRTVQQIIYENRHLLASSPVVGQKSKSGRPRKTTEAN